MELHDGAGIKAGVWAETACFEGEGSMVVDSEIGPGMFYIEDSASTWLQ